MLITAIRLNSNNIIIRANMVNKALRCFFCLVGLILVFPLVACTDPCEESCSFIVNDETRECRDCGKREVKTLVSVTATASGGGSGTNRIQVTTSRPMTEDRVFRINTSYGAIFGSGPTGSVDVVVSAGRTEGTATIPVAAISVTARFRDSGRNTLTFEQLEWR